MGPYALKNFSMIFFSFMSGLFGLDDFIACFWRRLRAGQPVLDQIAKDILGNRSQRCAVRVQKFSHFYVLLNFNFRGLTLPCVDFT